MGWLIKNGSYPYLQDAAAMPELLMPPTPLTMWKIRAGEKPCIPVFPQMPAFGCFANAVNLRNIHYRGTMAQWKEVQLGRNWNENAPLMHVTCRDGEVPCK